MSVPRRLAALLPLLGLALAATAADAPQRNPQPTDDPAASVIWQKARASLFDKRAIAPAPEGLLTLEAPVRAIDAAVVPVAIRTQVPPNAGWTISKLYLLIDANPSPISGIFSFGPDSGKAEVQTRVRVDGYSFVRAVAETSDGRLFMTHRFVKASGGCSAPPGSDPKAALATMGQMRLTTLGDASGKAPVQAQLAIQHPNHTGLVMDQLTREYTPAHFVRKVDVTSGGKPVFSADVDFSMSENPNFRFWFLPSGGELQVTVVDSRERTYSTRLQPKTAP
jgi:sulfur-oxidizing protein SoxY